MVAPRAPELERAEQAMAVPRSPERPREQAQLASALTSKPGAAQAEQAARSRRQIPALFLPPVVEKQDN
jgi:hypothetical protein